MTGTIPDKGVYYDPVIEIVIEPKTVTGQTTCWHGNEPVFETGEWNLDIFTRETRATEGNTKLIEVFTYIELCGQAAYDEAVGDIVCTQEEAEAMISLID